MIEYEDNHKWAKRWVTVTNEEAFHLTQNTDSPGLVYGFGVDQMPDQLQKGLKGMYTGYCSGYSTTVQGPDNRTIYGEFIAAREDEGIGKAYVYYFAKDKDGHLLMNGPHKPYPEHHYKQGDSVPIDRLFGRAIKKEIVTVAYTHTPGLTEQVVQEVIVPDWAVSDKEIPGGPGSA